MKHFSDKTQLGDWGKLYFEISTKRVLIGNQHIKKFLFGKDSKGFGNYWRWFSNVVRQCWFL